MAQGARRAAPGGDGDRPGGVSPVGLATAKPPYVTNQPWPAAVASGGGAGVRRGATVEAREVVETERRRRPAVLQRLDAGAAAAGSSAGGAGRAGEQLPGPGTSGHGKPPPSEGWSAV